VQALVVPRRDPATGDLDREASSFAVQWHHFAGATELEWMAARHFDDRVVGVGASRDVGGGVGRCDLTLTRLRDGHDVVSALVNLDHSWIWRGHDAYGFVELYRNGFGATRTGSGVAALAPALVDRLDRGEIFALGRDEAAVGARIDVTPLLGLEPTLLANLHDGSGLALVHLRRDLGDELRLDAGLQLPWGGHGNEYGGVPLAVGTADGRVLAPGNWLWVRISRYF